MEDPDPDQYISLTQKILLLAAAADHRSGLF